MTAKPKKKRARTPKKPPPDPIPTPTALSQAMLNTNTSQTRLAEPCHVYDVGKPIGAVLYRRLTVPKSGQS